MFSGLESGSDLLSRAVSSQVPSALRGLTSVFGMGTGGSLSPLPPEIVYRFHPAFPHLYNCTVRVDLNATQFLLLTLPEALMIKPSTY